MKFVTPEGKARCNRDVIPFEALFTSIGLARRYSPPAQCIWYSQCQSAKVNRSLRKTGNTRHFVACGKSRIKAKQLKARKGHRGARISNRSTVSKFSSSVAQYAKLCSGRNAEVWAEVEHRGFV